MAKMNVPFSFSGKWAGMSVYELKGVGTVARSRSGPKGHDVKTKPSFDLTRRNYTEHGACSTASKYLRRIFHPLEPARDYPMSGPVTGWLKDLLPYDTESEFGHRHILFSKAPRLLEGINLSRKHLFDSVVRGGISYELSRQTLSAAVHLPELKAGVSFTPTGKQPFFKAVAALGVVPDLLYGEEGYSFARPYEGFRPVVSESEWTPTADGSEPTILKLQLPYTPPNNSFVLVLLLGILMGTTGHRGRTEAVRYTGCAKVLAAG